MKKWRRLPPEAKTKIQSMILQGIKYEAIGAEFGKNRSAVTYYAKQMGYSRRKEKTYSLDTVLQLARAGVSYRAIARQLNLDSGSISRWARLHGIHRRPQEKTICSNNRHDVGLSQG